MRGYQGVVSWSVLLAAIGGAQAKLDLDSTQNLVVYWGQNSLNGKGDKLQQPLAHYCDNEDIDVIPMAFNMMVNGPGGAPEIDFAVTSKDCDVFPGTQLKNCPSIGKDIATCQKKGKTILLSIGGATYSEGGFKNEDEAKDGAKLMWETFGPKQEGSKALRPFGDTALDGFDFDFEANVENMAPFANALRSLMDDDKSKQRFYLTAAPQCPYPDQSDKEILNGPVYIDAIWVQFYNNFCGVNNFNTDMSSNKYNFEEWDNWAKTVSKNKNVKVIVGVPADTTAASTGYIPSSKLDNVIEYSKKFESFGGVMMWDATQAYGNDGFIKDVRKSLGGADDSGASSDPASPSAPSPSPSTSTDFSKETSSSSNVPDSSLSSSSSSSASASPKAPETTAEAKPPAETTAAPTTTTEPVAKSTTTAAPTPTATPQDDDSDDDDSDPLDNILGNDLMGLLGGLRAANDVAGGITHGLTKGLRRPKRSLA
ncbi:Glycoside hydrolase superfamily [Penicillium brevicompactum]|uniref:chitinase n=1 Tax=Penicillium brevicompactum TaxID=5074 RepID=A0A9W9R332_PENBR|nr:Glycoside hydrolase superfamily [Penicillium brevicompactum]KAJ5362808.1 Glycoside hydrolase superfamily [Penicillium brevicompactum]